MDPKVESIEEPQPSLAVGSLTLLKLPKLKHQRSLQELIGDDLESFGDGPIEMVELLMRRDEDNSDGVTIDATASETWDELVGSSAQPTSGDRSNQETAVAKTLEGTRFSQANFWKRLFRRKLSKSEQPKVIYSYKRRRLLREILWFHFLPVAINFTLLGLYIRQVLWTPPWPTTDMLNALQFAAKIHETLMIASLANVLLHHVRYRLLYSGARWLQLGLVTSPFRLLDITYLWSDEFSAAWCSFRKAYTSEVITIVMHIFLFTLAAVLGPASAITMLPRVGDWVLAWTITNAPFYSTHDRSNIYQVYMGGEIMEIFPKAIMTEFIPQACDYSNLTLPQSSMCPRWGLADILRGILPPETSNTGHDTSTSDYWIPSGYNIPVQAQGQVALPARKIRVSQYPIKDMPVPHEQSLGAIVDVTTSTDALVYLTDVLIGYYVDCWTMTLTAGDGTAANFALGGTWPAQFVPYPGQEHSKELLPSWKDPFVSSFCSEPVANTTVSGYATFDFVQNSSTPLYRVTLDVQLLFMALSDTNTGFIDSSDLNMTPNYTPSAAFVFTSQSYMTLCLVKVRWVNSSFSLYYPSAHYNGYFGKPDEVATGPTPSSGQDVLFRKDGWFNEAHAADMVHLDLDWLAVLNRGTDNDKKGEYSFFDKVRRICLGSLALDDDNSDHVGKHPDSVCMASGFGAGIAEGLSKVPYRSGIHALGSINDAASGQPSTAMTLSPWTSSSSSDAIFHDWDRPRNLSGNWTISALTPSQILSNSTRFDFFLGQTRHGYSFSGVTITLSFVVLFLYVATVFVHVSIVVFGTSWSSRAWTSLGQFFVLALNSPAPNSALDNTGGGVKVSETWRARVSVQYLKHEARVGIVVADPGRSDAENGSFSKVQPDRKYS